MSRLYKLMTGLAWAAGLVITFTLVGLPFVVYQDFGFSGPFLLSACLLLFVVLVIWCGL